MDGRIQRICNRCGNFLDKMYANRKSFFTWSNYKKNYKRIKKPEKLGIDEMLNQFETMTFPENSVMKRENLEALKNFLNKLRRSSDENSKEKNKQEKLRQEIASTQKDMEEKEQYKQYMLQWISYIENWITILNEVEMDNAAKTGSMREEKKENTYDPSKPYVFRYINNGVFRKTYYELAGMKTPEVADLTTKSTCFKTEYEKEKSDLIKYVDAALKLLAWNWTKQEATDGALTADRRNVSEKINDEKRKCENNVKDLENCKTIKEYTTRK